MTRINKLILAGLVAAMPAAAHATDLLTAGSTLPVPSSGFDWNRFYAGIYGVGQGSSADGAQLGAGIALGVDGRLEFLLVGGEVRIGGLDGGAGMTGYVQGLGKAGIALSDSAILYGAGGLGASFSGPGQSDALLGGGVELALTDDLSVDARYVHGFPISGANPKDQVTVGANFHF